MTDDQTILLPARFTIRLIRAGRGWWPPDRTGGTLRAQIKAFCIASSARTGFSAVICNGLETDTRYTVVNKKYIPHTAPAPLLQLFEGTSHTSVILKINVHFYPLGCEFHRVHSRLCQPIYPSLYVSVQTLLLWVEYAELEPEPDHSRSCTADTKPNDHCYGCDRPITIRL